MTVQKLMTITIGAGFLAATVGCTLNKPPTQREEATGIGALVGGGSGAIIGSVAGGALAGGLVGMPLGALAGYYYGDKLSYSDRVAVRETERGTVLSLSDVLFEFDRAELKNEARENVEPLVSYLKDNPAQRVVIEGYTDNVGTRDYNLDLSQRRAETVRNFLIQNGISPTRVTARGMGEANPIASNDTESGRQLNRRVEVVLAKIG